MNDPDHKIFRPDAVQRYLRGRQTPVWPRLVSPPVFLCLWILAGLLLAAGLSAWAFRVPVSISGTATVVRGTNGEMVIVAFFAPANLPRLDAGQKLVLSSPDGRGGFIEAIVSVKPAIISPEAARQRFALGVGAAHLITQPSACPRKRILRAPFAPTSKLARDASSLSCRSSVASSRHSECTAHAACPSSFK
jgi:hypothetical protein